MMLFLVFFAVVTNLSTFWCSLSVSRSESNGFLFEDGKLIADCFNKDSSECLSKLTNYKFVSNLYLEGFVFDEETTKQFSNIFTHLQDLILKQCDINDELVKLWTLPSGLKSFRLERMNFFFKEIHQFIHDLSPLLESFEVVDCLISELTYQELSIDSTSRNISLNFSKFSHLRNIHIDNLGENFDPYNLLLSLTLLPLERISLSRIHLGYDKWALLLNEFKEKNEVVFFNTLKEFELKIDYISKDDLIQLIEILFEIPCLEILSIHSNHTRGKIHFSSLPPNIKQFSLTGFEAFTEEGGYSFYNSYNLSHLTHLAVKNFSFVFPYYLFKLSQFEFFEISSYSQGICPSIIDQRCEKLKYLSILSNILIPLLDNFEINFPIIETLHINLAYSSNLNVHLKSIISSKTLKYLTINYNNIKETSLNIREKIKSSIEELKLTDIPWEYFSNLLAVVRFPFLKAIQIKIIKGFDLGEVLEKLTMFPQLTSLTLIGKFFLSNEQLSFRFENLKLFCLGNSQITFDLDLLLSRMPNLIELQLMGYSVRELKLQNPIGIRYLTSLENGRLLNRDFINVIKNTPNLVRLTVREICFDIQFVLFASELAYYFKELKKHFQNELQFDIKPNSFPIKQLKNDAKLLQLVRLKSSKLPNYLNRIFPIDILKSVVKQLFTIEIEKYLDVRSINAELVIRFFNLLDELEVDSQYDILFVKELVLEGKNQRFSESTDFSLDNFYELFLDYLAQSIEIYLEPEHLKFVKEFYKKNESYGPVKIYNFLKSFFTSLLVDPDQSIQSTLYTLYTYTLDLSLHWTLFLRLV